MTDLAAPCGLFCAQCPLYRAEQDREFNITLAEKMKVAPENARCPGCRPCSGKVTPMQGKCATYSCAESRGLHFCSQCSDFPCHKLAPCADRASLYPHNFKVFSLLRLEKKGREAWEEEYPEIARRYFLGRLVPGSEPEI